MDRKSITKNATWVLIGSAGVSILAFISTTILSRSLTMADFGAFRLSLAVLPILSICTLPDMSISVTRAIASGTLFNLHNITKIKIKYGLIGSLLGLIISLYCAITEKTTLAILFLIISAITPFLDTFLIYTNWLQGIKNFKLASILNLSNRTFPILCVAGTALVTRNIYIITIVYFVSQIAPAIVSYLVVASKYKFQKHPIPRKEIADYGKRLTLLGILPVLIANADKILVGKIFGETSLAIYSIGIIFPFELARLIESLSVASLPYFAESIGHFTKVKRGLPYIIIALLAIAFLLGLIVPFLIKSFFPAYTSSIHIAQIACVIIALLPVNSLLIRQLMATEQKERIFLAYSIKLVLYVILFFVFKPLGIISGIISLLMTEFIMLFFLVKSTPTKFVSTILKEESRFSRKIIVHKINAALPYMKPIINRLRFLTFREKCPTYPGIESIYSDGPWVDRKETIDQQNISKFVTSIGTTGKTILHVGIGSSKIADRFHKSAKSIYGITVVPSEVEYAHTLKLQNYNASLLNKNESANLNKLGTFDYIIDNDIAAYACCKSHFKEMFDSYVSMLNENGLLLCGNVSAQYFDSGFPFLPSERLRLAKEYELEYEEIGGVISFKKIAR